MVSLQKWRLFGFSPEVERNQVVSTFGEIFALKRRKIAVQQHFTALPRRGNAPQWACPMSFFENLFTLLRMYDETVHHTWTWQCAVLVTFLQLAVLPS